MDWEEDPFGHANDFDNQRTPFSQPSTPLPMGGAWENIAADSLEDKFARRLDYLLPIDGETGVATHEAVCAYLDTMIEMVSRHGLPLSVLSIAVDDSPVLRFLGKEGAALIGRGVARCLRQETRTHDVIGHADPEMSPDAFTFLVICPLLPEHQATSLGERLLVAMTASIGEQSAPWLTLSVGVVPMSLDVTDSKLLIARSMDALRRARRSGGNRVWRHTDTQRGIIDQAKANFDQPDSAEHGRDNDEADD
jgi:GGDEF domain-containing protein